MHTVEHHLGGHRVRFEERGLSIANNADAVAGYNNVLTLAPPLSITDDDLEFIASVLKGCFEQM